MPYRNCYLHSLSRIQQENLMKIDFFLEKRLNVLNVENGYILPAKRIKGSKPTFLGGVVDNTFQFVKESGQYDYGTNNKVIGSYEFSSSEIDIYDEDIIYLNMFFEQWGHFLIDTIGRLWYENENKLRYAYIIDDSFNNEINGNYLEFLNMLGITKDKLLIIRKPSMFRKIIIPETSIYPGKYYTKEYKCIIDKVIDFSLSDHQNINMQNNGIYLSRKSFSLSKSKDINENCLYNLLTKLGYKPISMETLSVKEQIQILNNCTNIICTSGTIAHNSIFIRNPNCRFTIINKSYRTNILQYHVNQLSSAYISFVDSYLSPMPISNGRGPFWIIISSELKEYLKKEMNYDIQIEKIHISDFLRYFYIWINNYKRRIFLFWKIGESDLPICKVQYTSIRSDFHKQFKKYM